MIFGAGQPGEPTRRGDDEARTTLPYSDLPTRHPGPSSEDPLAPAAGIIYGVLFGLILWALILGVIFHGD